jgi:hypothetical protein
LFCFADTDCAKIPDDLDIRKLLEKFITPPPGFTTPDISGGITDYTTPDWSLYSTTPFPPPKWPDTFAKADYTNNLMRFYAGFNAAWAVTCIIAIGKWKERAVEDSC